MTTLDKKALQAATDAFYDDKGGTVIAAITAYLNALSSIPEQGVGVKPLDDDQIMEIIRECFPWRTEAKIYDLLTHEKSPPMIPQATYDVPSYRAAKFVAAIETRIRSALAPSQPAAVGVTDEMVERVSVPYDGFTGDVIGSYITREGKQGVVVQQDGTRVVHVYGRSRVEAALRSTP